jgi:ATP-binding cassette subfamily F protein 3
MTVLSCSKLKKTYVVDPVLEDVSFIVEERDKIGLVGINGSGKTTLFQILLGSLEQDAGDIFKPRDLRIGYLEQNVRMTGERSIYDECLEVFKELLNVEQELRRLEREMAAQAEDEKRLAQIMTRYASLSERFEKENGFAIRSEIRGVLIGMGFEESEFGKRVDHLSGGQKSRLLLAKLLLQKPDLLLLDEPTNHLDLNAIEFLENYLKDFPGAVIAISHDRYFLDKFVNRIFHLERGRIRTYNTDYTGYMERRKKEREQLAREYENQQKEIARQQEIIERFANYGGSRYIRQSQSRQKLLDKMRKIDRPYGDDAKMGLRFDPKVESGKDVVLAEGLSKSYGGRQVFHDVGFEIYRGEKIGMIGANGVGKTTLFRLLIGEEKKDSGSIALGAQVNIAYFDQKQASLDDDNTVLDEIWDEYPQLTHYEVRSMLAKFMFTGDEIFKAMGELSGGERARVSLLKLMLSRSNLLLMDEPTNHLDIDSKEVLEDAILSYTGTCFIISHDRYFLNKTVDKIFRLEPDGVTTYLGNYDYYQEKLKESLEEETPESDVTKTQLQKEKKKKGESARVLRQLKAKSRELQERIAELEAEVEECKAHSYKPELYENHEDASALFEKIRTLEKEKDELYDRWIEIESRLEETSEP